MSTRRMDCTCIDSKLALFHRGREEKHGVAFCAREAGGALGFLMASSRTAKLDEVIMVVENGVREIHVYNHMGCAGYHRSAVDFERPGLQVEKATLFRDARLVAEIITEHVLAELGISVEVKAHVLQPYEELGQIKAKILGIEELTAAKPIPFSEYRAMLDCSMPQRRALAVA